MSSAESPEVRIAQHLGAWLKTRLTGCHFAAMLAKKDRVQPFVWMKAPEALPLTTLDSTIETAASEERFALLILPKLRDEAELVTLTGTLLQSPRWRAYDCSSAAGEQSYIAVDLRWQNGQGSWCSAMGLGPFGTMPLTRRAPYAALVLWGGSWANPFRKQPDPFVGVGDMNPDLVEKAYRDTHKATRADVKSLRELQGEAQPKTGVTFYFTSAAAQHLPLEPLS